jgi:hypothetical protein
MAVLNALLFKPFIFTAFHPSEGSIQLPRHSRLPLTRGRNPAFHMPPHPRRHTFNIEPRIPCEEKHLHHTASDKEKRCKQKKQPQTQAVLW